MRAELRDGVPYVNGIEYKVTPVLVFLDDRKMRIEVGYGLESRLTDAISSQILRQAVAPRFREGKIAEDAPLAATNPYGQTKLVGEIISRSGGQIVMGWQSIPIVEIRV